MTKQKLYKYIGYNGTITSPILLPDTNPLVTYQLDAAAGCYLTDGITKKYRVVVLEKDLHKWVETKGVID